MAQIDIEEYLKLVERAQANVRQISLVTLQCVLIAAAPADCAIGTHREVLQSRILRVEPAVTS